jgi:multidrug efflux pump subunit AcrA (membrane-fusion protein)
LQAESDRNQAQADLDSAEQGLKILGITNPADLEKMKSTAEVPLLAPIAGEVVERDVAPGSIADAGNHAGFCDFGHEHGVDSGECV